MSSPPNAFVRTFAHRDLFRGTGAWALATALLASLGLAMLLVHAGLLAGLMADRGRLAVSLTLDQAREFERLTGIDLPDIEPAAVTPPVAAEAAPAEAAAPAATLPQDGEGARAAENAQPESKLYTFDDHGILPSIWRVRDHWFGELICLGYRRTPALRSNGSALLFLLIVGAFWYLLRVFCLSRLRMLSRRTALAVTTRLRKGLHRQSLRLGPEDLSGEGGEEAARLFTVQTDAVQQGLFEWITRTVRYPVELGVLLLVAIGVDLSLTLQWIVPVGLLYYVVQRARARADHERRLAEDRSLSELRILSESLTNSRLVKAYSLEQTEQAQFEGHLQRYVDNFRKMVRTEDNTFWVGFVAPLVGAALILFLLFLLIARALVDPDHLSIGGAVVFLAAVALSLRALDELWQLPQVRNQIAVAATAIYRYLDQTPTVGQSVGAKFLQPLSRTLHFDNVTLNGPDRRRLLDRVDLRLVAGRSYAIVSLDPLESRALLSLLPRFVEPQQGRVLYDGEDIAWGTLESLRAETLYVTGNDAPVYGTVLDNLRAGNPEISLQAATDAAKTAHAHNFIVRMPNGYETVLGGADGSLDAGQAFRLSLARAVVRNPAVLIIEEPRQILDDDAKAWLSDTYERLLPNRTVIFLPTRLSTLKRVDEVIVVDQGRVVAVGPQSILVNQSPIYRHWEYIHFNEFRRQSDEAGG